jgi:SAM-dependent methyltransferase
LASDCQRVDMSVESVVPSFLLPCYRRARSSLKNQLMGGSNERVFSKIYRDSLWGKPTSSEQKFYSGTGSYDPTTDDYVAVVRQVIADYNVKSVLEIGCGDFSVASRYVQHCDYYTGVDVVPELVAYNNFRFGRETTRFLCADASRQQLPTSDLCIIRQVLQHLSNRDISNILENSYRSRLLLVTEHLPRPDHLRQANLDKSACPDVRVSFGSGVYLDQPPFNLDIEVLLDVAIRDYYIAPGERLKTVLIRNS